MDGRATYACIRVILKKYNIAMRVSRFAGVAQHIECTYT